ncbi:MAG TPA: hydroxyisourate hydrolase [Nocardioidaceae bacterium]|jgi:5-hydroxyisourate hydrolase
MSHVTTHVLDTAHGRPAVGLTVVLEHDNASATEPPAVATGETDEDGRVADLGPERLDPGTYRLRFNTGAYFATAGAAAFYPEVSICFEVTDDSHYHVPLLLSPFGYSTYRGS